MVGAAMAERQLVRLVAGREARAAGGRGRCRAPAPGRASRARPRSRASAAPDRQARSTAARRRSRRARPGRRRAGRRSRPRRRRRGAARSSAWRRSRRARRGRARARRPRTARVVETCVDERLAFHRRLCAHGCQRLVDRQLGLVGDRHGPHRARLAQAAASSAPRVDLVERDQPVPASQSAHAPPPSRRISTARACGRADSRRESSTP